MSQPLDEARIREAGLTEVHVWPSPPGEDDLAALPDRPAVVLLADAALRPVLLTSCGRLRSFLRHRFLQRDQPSRRADLRQVVRRAYWRELATAFEQRWWYWKLARWLYPREYRRLIDFGPSFFLHLDPAARIPQIRVSERVYAWPGEFVGPFATAQEAAGWLEGLWDLFDLCRFPQQLARAPRGTACAYAEMGRCDAPCDGRVPLDPYLQRCRAAWSFVTGGPAAHAERLAQQMRDAAATRAFERAALLRDQLRFVQRWTQQLAGRLRIADRWCDLILLPVRGRRQIKPLLFCRGVLLDGPAVRLRGCEAAIQAWLEAAWPGRDAGVDPPERMEQTWLVSRLVHSPTSQRAALLALDPLDDAVPDVRGDVVDTVGTLQQRSEPACEGPAGTCGGDA